MSKVRPSTCALFTVGIVMLFICSFSFVLYCAESEVKSKADDLSGLSVRSFSCVHFCILSRYGCNWDSDIVVS